MKSTEARSGRHMLDGSLRVMFAEGLFMPTALITAIFLTRRLGPDGYGLLALSAMLVGWFEWAVPAIFERASIKLVGEARDWRPVGAVVVRLYFIASLVAALLFWALAGPIAAGAHEPMLATYLRLYSLQIPICGLAQAHRNILVGIGGFREQARVAASRWVSRLALVVILVEMGLSVEGAILGSVGSVFVEFVLARFFVRPSLFQRSDFPMRRMMEYAAPLFLFAVSFRVYDEIDLFMLKMLGGTAADAGVYGAAQSLCMAPGLFAMAVSPLLLSSLSRLTQEGNLAAVRRMSSQGLRGAVGILPLAGAVAGAADELVVLIFGEDFRPGGTLLSILILSTTVQVVISIAAAILTGIGRPRWTFVVTGPLVPLVTIGHFLFIPRLGPVGTAWVTTGSTILGTIAAIWIVHRLVGASPPAATLVRGVAIGLAAYTLAVAWPAAGLMVLVKLTLIGLAAGAGYLLLGEFRRDEIALVRSLFVRRPAAEAVASPPTEAYVAVERNGGD